MRFGRDTVLLVCRGSRWNRSWRTGSGERPGLEIGRIREIVPIPGGDADPTT
jgi:hypothetical protein